MQISRQAAYFVDLEMQISWQYFVGLEVEISWQAQFFVDLEVQKFRGRQYFVDREMQIAWQAQFLLTLRFFVAGSTLWTLKCIFLVDPNTRRQPLSSIFLAHPVCFHWSRSSWPRRPDPATAFPNLILVQNEPPLVALSMPNAPSESLEKKLFSHFLRQS